MKNKDFDALIEDMSKCLKCLNLDNKSLINYFGNSEFAKRVPSIWTDWYDRLDSPLFIIGQDWGPYKDMVELHDKYINGESKYDLIDSEKSLTQKKLFKFLSESAKIRNQDINFNKIYITNAIMCARTGEDYRGNNINLRYSTNACSSFLRRQIEIVRPKVILTLGYYPLASLAHIYGFSIKDTLSGTIEEMDIIKVNDLVIIPVFHPTAQVTNSRQLEQYKKIWDYL